MAIKHVTRPHNWVCAECGKRPASSLNRPHSLHRTRRTVWPNLQMVNGRRLCTKCIKTGRTSPATTLAA
ncbi:50S ribosomal protein L28 [Candidatus Berkelbacteria bacterium]|nr:50S ribosomal protein L28 [Candidatus Berkelbacteria bacterium]